MFVQLRVAGRIGGSGGGILMKSGEDEVDLEN
jgi:hypothetical protein